MPVLINFTAFKLGWAACVFGGAAGTPWIGVLAVLAVVALHAWRSPDGGAELRLVLLAGALGTVWDSLLVATGVLVYPSGQLATWLAPVWISGLWMAFATSLNVTMRWMRERLFVAAVFGAVGGPLAFWGGTRLGAVAFPDSTLAIVVLGVGWMLLMPTLVVLAARFDGWAEPAAAEAPTRSEDLAHAQ